MSGNNGNKIDHGGDRIAWVDGGRCVDNGVFLDGRGKALAKHGSSVPAGREKELEKKKVVVEETVKSNKVDRNVKRLQESDRKTREWVVSQPMDEHVKR